MAGNPWIISAAVDTRGLRLKDLPGLVKAHLSLYIALTAVAGHALAQNHLSYESLLLGGWVLLLSCGAGVLNNIQDRDRDRLSIRTKFRVLARGDMAAGPALIFCAGLVLVALTGLWLSCASAAPLLLGGGAIVCYNGIYTPMKQRGQKERFMAMVPGTLCGMIPPAMGWAAVDSAFAVTDRSGLYILMTGLGVWQFPHFLMVFLKENRLDGQFLTGGFMSEGECRAQVVAWSALFSLSMVLFALKGWMVSQVLSVLLVSLALVLPLFLSFLFWKTRHRSLDMGFWGLNLAMLGYMILILLDRV